MQKRERRQRFNYNRRTAATSFHTSKFQNETNFYVLGWPCRFPKLLEEYRSSLLQRTARGVAVVGVRPEAEQQLHEPARILESASLRFLGIRNYQSTRLQYHAERQVHWWDARFLKLV